MSQTTKTMFISEMFIIACWTIIIESYIQRKSRRKFWQLSQRIDEQYAQHNDVKFQKYLIKFFVFSIFKVSIIIHAHYVRNVLFHLGIILSSVLEFICFGRMLYYLFYVEVIQFELKVIENEPCEQVKRF